MRDSLLARGDPRLLSFDAGGLVSNLRRIALSAGRTALDGAIRTRPINYVGKVVGHANLSTNSRYPNIQRRGLHLAM